MNVLELTEGAQPLELGPTADPSRGAQPPKRDATADPSRGAQLPKRDATADTTLDVLPLPPKLDGARPPVFVLALKPTADA